MSKTKNTVKYIYLTKFDSETLTFTTQRLEVSREYSRYISLADGSRINTEDISDLAVKNSTVCRYVGHNWQSVPKAYGDLLDNGCTYSIKPLSKAVKDRVCDERLLDVASSIDRHEQEIKRYTSLIADEEKDLAKDKALFAKLKAIHCK